MADAERSWSWLAKIATRDHLGAANAQAHVGVQRGVLAVDSVWREALAAEAPAAHATPGATAAASAAATPVRPRRLAVDAQERGHDARHDARRR